jgi:(1->4)-alpha-D-glucan 1-alpha-D-glucosylmutase
VDPTATYRLQLHRDFPLAAARDVVAYLDDLGVSHVYASPLLHARAGSTHGYDVVDPTEIDPELGSEGDLAALADALHARGMGLVLDIVPNHMAASRENPFWDDVLAHGPSSAFAAWFDVDWGPSGDAAIVVPVLGDLTVRVVERGEIRPAWTGTRVRLRYFDHDFPLDPATVPAVLAAARGPDGADREDVEAILDTLRALPPRAACDPSRRTRADAALDALAALAAARSAIATRIETAIAACAGERARLAALLDAQAYRLVYWKRAAGEISYRRFFNVSDLVGIRVEDDAVFEPMHALVFAWIARRWVDGLRVDHVDGLWDPRGYLERLHARASAAAAGGDVPVWVEKILTGPERLREEWPVAGTTGYEFLNALEAILVDAAGFATIEERYRRLVRARAGTGFEAAARAGKRRLLDTWLAPDVRRLARLLLPLARREPAAASLRERDVVAALVELLIAMPVYRTYVDEGGATADDRAILAGAVAELRTVLGLVPAAVDLIARTLLEPDADAAPFVRRFQQTAAPVMAKGVEDTALYRWIPLVSRNEVGGNPGAPLADAVDALHAANAARAVRWPRSLLATTTHDTKRSADVRARLDVLAEMPARWSACVARWRAMNAAHRRRVGSRLAPDANTEYLLYQTLVGVWPLRPHEGALADVAERVRGYMLKASREAKVSTSWLEADAEFEAAVDGFVAAALDPAGAFVSDLAGFVADVAHAGLWNALARTLVHLTAPGVPDVYQGDELWKFALTDPDNRRPVDFAARRRLLAAVGAEPASPAVTRELVARADDGRAKLHVVRTALRLRDAAALFRGAYAPLRAEGAHAAHVFAFARHAGERSAVTVVPRLPWTLAGGAAPVGERVWGDTRLVVPPGVERNVLTGESCASGTVPVATLLADFPVALVA